MLNLFNYLGKLLTDLKIADDWEVAKLVRISNKTGFKLRVMKC